MFLQIVVFVFGVLYLFFRRQYGYWPKRNVTCLPPRFPLGNMGNQLRTKITVSIRLQRHYEFCKSQGSKHFGLWLLWSPIYVPIDPEIIKRIMVSDAESFLSRGFYTNVKSDPLSGMILILSGQRWRRLRTLLTPTFTSGKMKSMFPVVLKCGEHMTDILQKIDLSKPVNIKELTFCYTTDVICACSFGMDCNTCENPNEEIRVHGKTALTFNRKRALKNFVTFALPNLCALLNIKIVPREVNDFFTGTIKKAIDFRKTNNYYRKDLLQSMMEMLDDEKLSIDELTAQAFAFYLAGFETSATTITFCLFELSQQQDIQERARRDVTNVIAKHDGEITYDGIAEMTYLRQVVDETLRKYPPLPITIRRCTKDYVEPDTNLTIEKGTLIFIPIRALHYDPDYFPEPETFDPERFNKENKSQIKPFTYLPFGDGPRNCLGARFGLIQTMLAVAAILRSYKFTMHSKTQLPIHYNPFNFTLDLESDFYLSMEKIDS